MQEFSTPEGVGNAGRPMHPQPRMQNVESIRVSHHGRAGSPGIPARDGFNGFLRALPGDRACLPPSPSGSLPPDLTPASGRQDHTTSPSAAKRVRPCATCVHHILPRVRDDLEPPLLWDRTAKDVELIWVGREQRYFCWRDWTTQITLIPRENFSSRRMLEAWAGGS